MSAALTEAKQNGILFVLVFLAGMLVATLLLDTTPNSPQPAELPAPTVSSPTPDDGAYPACSKDVTTHCHVPWWPDEQGDLDGSI